MPATVLYLLVIVPPEPVLGQVWALKQELHHLTGSRNAIRLRPHITLWPPLHRPATFAQEVYPVLSAFAAQQKEFAVTLRNFDWFENRTLFVRVETKIILQEFNARLSKWCRDKGVEIPPEKRPFTPHMTLATRDLPADQINTLRQLFAARVYSATFPVAGLTLFRHSGTAWEIAAEFSLTPQN
ncbi:2'-5' RNA ligase family protein [Hymenobacter lutimineralis]|uniref:2'-5' RNA ligase family protein n=1 Tax=Hymenobacter lutimineralis TaxID=2606448 RepID=A0A5D6UWG4_9BACT|nr:2'-5' RNA ligase family protein [Hymenobacter lutimineralis]TYZ08091.1 2'-5' RNA ligase family protein [Hymenobacter lutimineralis]